MSDLDCSRRRFLLLTGQVGIFCGLLYFDDVVGQEGPRAPASPGLPMPPGFGSEPDDPSKKKIPREEYETWLREVRGAAKAFAAKTGAEYRSEALENFEKNALKTLEDNGYRVPSPPTNLQIR